MEKRYAERYTSHGNEYMTPPSLFQPLLDFMGIGEFDYDSACSNMNIPAKKYRTPDGEYSKEDFFFKLSDRDGLAGGYGPGIHFCNPPFNKTKNFLKMISEEVAKEPNARWWCIVPSDRWETKYYKEYILMNPNCFFVCLPKQGFLKVGSPVDKPVPSVKVMYLYYGQDAERTAASFKELHPDEWAVVYNIMAKEN